jgi:hypothetical protein
VTAIWRITAAGKQQPAGFPPEAGATAIDSGFTGCNAANGEPGCGIAARSRPPDSSWNCRYWAPAARP